jgi:ATP-dependent helicase/DNAse subunit B
VDFTITGPVLELVDGVADPQYKPQGLSHPAVLEAIRSRRALSAGSLERWIECSYRWFVSHELSPQRLEPTADPLWLGGLVHRALQELYEEPPGEDGIPRPGDVGRWKRRFEELLDGLVAEDSGGTLNAERQIALARVRIQVAKFLDEEAERDIAFRPRPDLLERSFGFSELHEDDPGGLDLGDFELRGFIDRIDVAPDGRSAIVRDYKTSKAVPGRQKIADDGKLQLPLYMLVARELLNLDPIAGLYHPLAAYGDRRGRGYGLRSETGEDGLLENAGIMTKSKDCLDRSELDEALDHARERARVKGLSMRAGEIDRDPLGGKCPKYCEYQPICRLERALGLEDDGDGVDRE